MSDCHECLKADVYCAYDLQVLCKFHSFEHIGPPHYLICKTTENIKQIQEFNKKVMEKSRENLTKLENDRSKGLRPFWIENGKRVYLNKAKDEDLNSDVIPVVIDGSVWLVDLVKESFKIVKENLNGRAGFTMNVFNNRLILTGGHKSHKILDDVDDLFDKGFKLKLANPRFFHSAVIHRDVLFVIGGLLKYKSYFTIESLNLSMNQTENVEFSDILCKIVSPLSFIENDSIFTFFFNPKENEKQVLIFNTQLNSRNTESLSSYNGHISNHPIFRFAMKSENFWTPSNLVYKKNSESTSIHIYLPENQEICKIQDTKGVFSIQKSHDLTS